MGFTSCSPLTLANITPTHISTETPTNTLTPSPTATITPNFTATQRVVNALETQVAQQATATAQEQIAQITAQAEATHQTQEAEQQKQIDAFYAEAEAAGIVINKYPEFIQNNSDIVSFYFSEGVLEGKNIKKIVFNKKYQDNLGYYDLSKIAGVMWSMYADPAYSDVAHLCRNDPKGRDVTSYISYGHQRYQRDRTFPVRGTTIFGEEVMVDITQIEYQLVKKQEFENLLSIAQELEIPIITDTEENNFPNSGTMIYFQGSKMIAIVYINIKDLTGSPQQWWPFGQINVEMSHLELFGSFHLTHQDMLVSTLVSLMYNNQEVLNRLDGEDLDNLFGYYNCLALDGSDFCENVSDDLAKIFQ